MSSEDQEDSPIYQFMITLSLKTDLTPEEVKEEFLKILKGIRGLEEVKSIEVEDDDDGKEVERVEEGNEV